MDKQYAIVYKKKDKYTVFKTAPTIEKIALLLKREQKFLSQFQQVEIVELIEAEGDSELKWELYLMVMMVLVKQHLLNS